jgi:hypothetical protein
VIIIPINGFATPLPNKVHPSTVPNNSVNPPGTSSEGSDEPHRPNAIPFDLDNDQEDTNLTNQDDVTSSLDASAELMRRHLQLGHLGLQTVKSRNANPVSMEKLPSILGELRDSQVLSRRSSYQVNASQWINWSHQWPVSLHKTKDSSFASATRLLQSLWNISAVCLMFTSKSHQKGCKIRLPRDCLKPIPLTMESRSNSTIPAMRDLLSTYSSITVRNWGRRYPCVESVHTSKMELLKGGSRTSLKGPERPYYTPFTGVPQQSQ